MDYVSQEASKTAKDWEKLFQELPPAAGVLFVSVYPKPALGGSCRSFEIRLGIVQTLEESTGLSILKHVLAEEIESGRYEIEAAVYRGVECSGSSKDHTASSAYPT